MSFRTDRYELISLTGTVASAQTYATSHVSGSAVTTDHQGNVSGGGVSTTVVHHLKFFLVLPDGREQDISVASMSANAFSVRDGHRVTVSCLQGRPFHFFHNHTTGQEAFDGAVIENQTRRWWNVERPLGMLFYISLFLAVLYFVAWDWKWEKLFDDHPSFEFYFVGDLFGVPLLAWALVWMTNKLLTVGERAEWRHLVDRTRAGISA